MNRHFYADLDEEMDEEIFKSQKPRQLAAEHRVRKMRQEREEGRKKRHAKRRRASE
ncbi:MAG: hypothetical protein P8Z31_03285 [Gammaproteobacteria bacterium]